MRTAVEQSTVSLWSLWLANRDELAPFDSCCALARSGKLPGAIEVANGTPRVRADRVSEALAAMRKGLA